MSTVMIRITACHIFEMRYAIQRTNIRQEMTSDRGFVMSQKTKA